MEKLDCRGLDCPGPVLEARTLIEAAHPDRVDVLVDNDSAVENVSRFMEFSGYSVSVDSDGQNSVITAIMDTSKSRVAGHNPSTEPDVTSAAESSGPAQKILILVGSMEIGRGDSELGQKLMVNYLKTLREMGNDLWHLIFVNHGVRFAIEGSPVLDELKELEENGTRILVCGTCLTHLSLMDRKALGQTTNMLDIVTAMQLADKTIQL